MHISYLALVSKRMSAIQRIAESSLVIGTLPLLLLPNWAFDYGYALFKLDEQEKAHQQIKESLMRWPQVIRLFLEKAVRVMDGFE